MDRIGERLREERNRLKCTQKDFAALGGVLANAQSKYEHGQRSPSALYLARLARIGVDVLYVLTAHRVRRDDAGEFVTAISKLTLDDRRIITDLVECIARKNTGV